MGGTARTGSPLCPLMPMGPHLVVAVFLPHVLNDVIGTINDGFYVLIELLLARVCAWRRQTWGRRGW